MKSSLYKMRAELWEYPGQVGNWYFVTLPKNIAEKIKKEFGKSKRGFGSIRVEVTVGKSKWLTSIFPDKRSESYLLPIKASVRKKEGIFAGDLINLIIQIRP